MQSAAKILAKKLKLEESAIVTYDGAPKVSTQRPNTFAQTCRFTPSLFSCSRAADHTFMQIS
jgi:hypothetical protein